MRDYSQNKRIPFTDDVMFSLVMQDKDICRRFLQRILPDEEIGEIRIEGSEEDLTAQTQKTIKFPPGIHGVRLDAFIKSGNFWAEVEMQTHTGEHIAKRARYYHANMDLDYLGEGHKYKELPRSYVIFICTVDYIGAGLPVYFFEKYDRKNGLILGDESYSIILNTACPQEKVPVELKALFAYINDPNNAGEAAMSDSLVSGIDRQVSKYNTDEWRRRQMTIQELMDRNYEDGLEQGRSDGEAAATLKLARTMKTKKLKMETITEITGLSAEEIEKL